VSEFSRRFEIEKPSFPLDGGREGMGVRAMPWTDLRRRRIALRAYPETLCTHPHPCPSPIEGEGMRKVGDR
jgi:hypothetical protein